MENEHKKKDRIHVIYLSKEASYQNLENDTLVMGFYDNFTEIFRKNANATERKEDSRENKTHGNENTGNNVGEIDYLSAFGIHTPSFLATKHLTAKQLFTLVEFEKPLECHYQMRQSEDDTFEEWRFFRAKDSQKPNKKPPHFGQSIIPERTNPACNTSGDLPDGAKYPAFIGVVLVSLDYFQQSQSESSEDNGYSVYHDDIRERLQKFITTARSEKEIPTSAGEFSRYAEIRMFQCTNCSDLCFTVSTIRLLDILLLSKAVQICVKEKSRAQFSPVWSFVTVPTRALEEPDDIQKKRSPNGENSTPFDEYIQTVVAANSYRKNREKYKDVQPYDNEAITVDFRVSFHDFEEERKFLKTLKNPQEVEKENKPVDDIYRVAGVLGNGTYSVHLPFHEYLELFRFKYLHKQTLLGKQTDLETNQPHLNYLIKAITGREKLDTNDSGHQRPSTVDISYQRIRYCYVGHIFNSSDKAKTKFYEAECQTLEKEKVSYNPGGGNGGKIEALIYRLLNYLSIYRNKISSNEYRFREAIYLAKDLVYTYNDLFARGNLKTIIFITQIFAMLRDTELYCEDFTTETVGRTESRRLIQEVTENLRMACLALNRYSHEAVMNAGNNFNTQTYEIQSKVNIEKYIVAYSFFMQQIFKDYSKEQKRKGYICRRLYPFVYLDIEEKKILMYTLFRRLKMPEKNSASPVLLAVAVPNYRRFANIYRILPQLVHEMAHQFIYYPEKRLDMDKVEEDGPDDYLEENCFVLNKSTGYLAEMLAVQFCEIETGRENKNINAIQKSLAQSFAKVLVEHREEFIPNQILAKNGREFLQERVLRYYVRDYLYVNPDLANQLNDFQGYKKEEKLEWELLKERLQELAWRLHIRYDFEYEKLKNQWQQAEKCSEYAQILLSSLFGILREVTRNDADMAEEYVNILANTLARQTICNYMLDEKSEEVEEQRKQIVAEIWRGIRIKAREGYEGTLSCLAVTVHHQIFIDILSAVLLAGIEQFDEFCPEIGRCMDNDSELEEIVSTLYSAGDNPGIREEFRKLNDYINREKDIDSLYKEELKIIEKQIEVYCTILHSIARVKTLRFYPLKEESNYINTRLCQAVWQLTVDFAEEKNPAQRSFEEIELLNRFSDRSMNRYNINRMLAFLSSDGYVKALYAYANVHSEICADLGMCAAFGFNAFGYLVFQANLHIDHMENEDMIDDNLVDEPAEHYQSRNRKYLEVLKTLSAREKGQKDLVEETTEMLEVLKKQIRQVYLPELKSSAEAIWKNEGSALEKLCGTWEGKKTLSQIPNKVQQLVNGLNNLGSAIRQIIASAPQPDLGLKFGEEVAEPERDNYMHLADTISDYLRYARVINHICRSLSDCGFNESAAIEAPESYYKELYENILKYDWVKNVRTGSYSLCTKIGRFYNESAVDFHSSYSLEDQVEFVLEYYTKAHDFYQPLYRLLTESGEWLENEENPEQKDRPLWEKVDKWFNNFFD